jgi:tRNA threonylcarbamoyladenosine modification (KEOPS) complex  Pcc1 subunit
LKNTAISRRVSSFVMPESSTKIEIEYSDDRTARAIQKAITPDNIGAPDGMHIMAYVQENKLKIEITSDRSIGSLVSTLDDLLSCVQAAEKTLEKI